jgi:hypothetical protein
MRVSCARRPLVLNHARAEPSRPALYELELSSHGVGVRGLRRIKEGLRRIKATSFATSDGLSRSIEPRCGSTEVLNRTSSPSFRPTRRLCPTTSRWSASNGASWRAADALSRTTEARCATKVSCSTSSTSFTPIRRSCGPNLPSCTRGHGERVAEAWSQASAPCASLASLASADGEYVSSAAVVSESRARRRDRGSRDHRRRLGAGESAPVLALDGRGAIALARDPVARRWIERVAAVIARAGRFDRVAAAVGDVVRGEAAARLVAAVVGERRAHDGAGVSTTSPPVDAQGNRPRRLAYVVGDVAPSQHSDESEHAPPRSVQQTGLPVDGSCAPQKA